MFCFRYLEKKQEVLTASNAQLRELIQVITKNENDNKRCTEQLNKLSTNIENEIAKVFFLILA